MARPSAKEEQNESTLTRSILRVHRLLLKRGREKFSGTDRSFEEWMALRLFADGLVETAGDLARETGIATGATTRLIDSLAEQGFIERASKEGDRRVVVLRLTKRGAAHHQEKRADLHQCWNEVLEDWSRTEIDQLATLLTKLQASFLRTDTK